MKKVFWLLLLLALVLTGCLPGKAKVDTRPAQGEEEVIFWLQAYNSSGTNQAYFFKPELWIVSVDGQRRQAISDQSFKVLGRNMNWDGAYYPSANGPVGNSVPSAQTFDISMWRASAEGVLSVRMDRPDHYYDLWNVRFRIMPGEHVEGTLKVMTEGIARTRFGLDYWAKDGGKDTTNRPIHTEWYTGSEWKKLSLP